MTVSFADLVQSLGVLPILDSSFMMAHLASAFSQMYFVHPLIHRVNKFDIEHRMPMHSREATFLCHNVERVAISPSSRLEIYIVATRWWDEYEGLQCLLVPSLLVLAYYFNLVLSALTMAHLF